MNKPKSYLQSQEEIVKRSKHFFNNYFHLIRQTDSAKKKVLDIGCGPGNVTHDVLYPLFQFEIDEVVGIDVSEEMIQYAKVTYKNDKFSFRLADILNSNMEFFEYFDYVFSLCTLQWIQDQRTLYSNIYRLMKPESEMLLSFIQNYVFYDIFRAVWHKSLYKEHIKDFSSMIAPFAYSEDPENELKTLLQDTGFDVRLCKLTKWRMYSTSSLKSFIISINSAYDQIPKHLQENFIRDHFEEMENRGFPKYEDNFVIDYDLFVVYARKTKKEKVV